MSDKLKADDKLKLMRENMRDLCMEVCKPDNRECYNMCILDCKYMMKGISVKKGRDDCLLDIFCNTYELDYGKLPDSL